MFEFIVRILSAYQLNGSAKAKSFVTYVQRVGALSLAALVGGGAILVLFAANILAAKVALSSATTDGIKVVFRVGSQLGIQVWLVFLGMGFGLLSYGISESYNHAFDVWCSLRVNEPAGLDYARYLNSQPRAPVLVGIRGFPGFVLLRHLITALCLAASVGYKFAVTEINIRTIEHIEESYVNLRVPPTQGLLANGTTSPWLGDAPGSETNRAFRHQHDFQNDKNPNPPQKIVMASWADCGDTFGIADSGLIYTRELVIVAERTDDSGEFFMTLTDDVANWTRTESLSTQWTGPFGTIPSGTVVDYRLVSPVTVQIQWAERGNWSTDVSAKQPAVRRITYGLHLVVANVSRTVQTGSCSELDDSDGTQLSAELLMDVPAEVKNASRAGSYPGEYWIDALIRDPNNGPSESVSVIVRSEMVEWAAMGGIQLGHAPQKAPGLAGQDGPWLNQTDISQTSWTWIAYENAYQSTSNADFTSTELLFPVYSGIRTTGRTGAYYVAAYIFLGLGIFSYILAGFRLLIGPAELTSWVGQRIYLALEGKVKLEAAKELASGYVVAQKELGMLRFKSTVPPVKIYTGPDFSGYMGRWVNG